MQKKKFFLKKIFEFVLIQRKYIYIERERERAREKRIKYKDDIISKLLFD